MEKVKGPAIALMVVGILGLVCTPLSLLSSLGVFAMPGAPAAGELSPDAEQQFKMWKMYQGVLGTILSLLALAASILILYGALQMKKGKNWTLAVTTSVVAMIPMVSPCCLIGLPFGIWALVVLMKPEVKQAFTVPASGGPAA